MKFIIPILALFTTALGNPTQSKRWACTPGTYSCTNDKNGWQVCDVSGDWVVSYQENSPLITEASILTKYFPSLPAPAHRRPAAFFTQKASHHTAFLLDSRFRE